MLDIVLQGRESGAYERHVYPGERLKEIRHKCTLGVFVFVYLLTSNRDYDIPSKAPPLNATLTILQAPLGKHELYLLAVISCLKRIQQLGLEIARYWISKDPHERFDRGSASRPVVIGPSLPMQR
ncbi:hypothetical protein V1478_017225 [Vespula squamosa]|uniref:Uncharacterized protein n=1 Tax=Vespula squamosa TaxID=30214 RepID=A0ABD1ZXY7_VESSQ